MRSRAARMSLRRQVLEAGLDDMDNVSEAPTELSCQSDRTEDTDVSCTSSRMMEVDDNRSIADTESLASSSMKADDDDNDKKNHPSARPTPQRKRRGRRRQGRKSVPSHNSKIVEDSPAEKDSSVCDRLDDTDTQSEVTESTSMVSASAVSSQTSADHMDDKDGLVSASRSVTPNQTEASMSSTNPEGQDNVMTDDLTTTSDLSHAGNGHTIDNPVVDNTVGKSSDDVDMVESETMIKGNSDENIDSTKTNENDTIKQQNETPEQADPQKDTELIKTEDTSGIKSERISEEEGKDTVSSVKSESETLNSSNSDVKHGSHIGDHQATNDSEMKDSKDVTSDHNHDEQYQKTDNGGSSDVKPEILAGGDNEISKSSGELSPKSEVVVKTEESGDASSNANKDEIKAEPLEAAPVSEDEEPEITVSSFALSS